MTSPRDPLASTSLVLTSTVAAGNVPVSTGVCFPEGLVRQPEQVELLAPDGASVLAQKSPSARWPDGSVKWMLLDFVAVSVPGGQAEWPLVVHDADRAPEQDESPLVLESSEYRARASSGPIALELEKERLQVRPRSSPTAHALHFVLQRRDGRTVEPQIRRTEWEATGPVRATLRVEGTFPGCRGLCFVARVGVYAGTGLVHATVRLHNANPARHRGGLWDLGDTGSFLFKSLTLEVGGLEGNERPQALLKPEPDAAVLRAEQGRVELYQDSSGGENWRSRNHVNREGRIPCRFRGYRIESPDGERDGLRSSPVLVTSVPQGGSLAIAVPEFWQQFPKSVGFTGERLRIGFFPEQWDDLFELQGGEQKTHSVWLNFSDRTECDEPAADALNWVHAPVRPSLAPQWYARSEVFPCFATAKPHATDPLHTILGEAIRGERSLLAKREVIDEYGWRNFGEIWGDHEQAYSSGPRPVISHYNNQFDVILGALLQWARTGDPAWMEVADPLARHVIDVDIYHTQGDRAAYNGGLFWHTDHYLDAGRCTHRTYSRSNQPPGKPYGGGPADEHNYTTGLLYYYHLTGNPDARDAVLSLAEWVIGMDDGRQTPFFVFDDGSTGLASKTSEPNYHGPGRGAGNSVNALLDAWQLTDEPKYAKKAEELIRRAVHPEDDIASLDLLNTELRWSYTVFLLALLRYVDLKRAAGELDEMYAYGASTLAHYALWMAKHERPALDHREELEYPTETWAAQELRKANVLRLAARYISDPVQRNQALDRGRQLADRAWADLMSFESRHVARAVALVMTEGSRSAFLDEADLAPAPPPQPGWTPPARRPFVSQRGRAQAKIRSARGLLEVSMRLTRPGVWRAAIAAFLRRL